MPGRQAVAKRSDEDELDRVFHALADRTRRAIVRRLAQGPASVSELAQPFAMTLPAVSKHIRVLEAAHLVSRRPAGGFQRCDLTAAPFDDAVEWIETHRSLWTDALDRLAAFAETPETPE